MFRKLEEERSSLSFDPKEIGYILFGGKKQYERAQELAKILPGSWDPNNYNLSRIDQIKLSIKELVNINKNINLQQYLTLGISLLKGQFEYPGTIHLNMFIPCVKILGSDPQGERLLEKCATYEIIGCYAQTELGHGSDVQNLETTAELDLDSDQFVINTPTISAAKYWPGDLGIFANWALVFAKLIIKGVNHGVQSFLVQIRDDNGQPMPGVQVGDIGPKFGYHTKDNGYLIMKNVRTHRKYMLRRYAKVEKDGTFTLRGNQKISYATMMLIRKLISAMSPKIFGIGLTIAGRYSFARKQFKNDKKQEIPIIDYQLQQNKIISCLANYYAITINGVKVSTMAENNYINVSQNDDDSMMKETHNCLCLTKAYNSQISMRDLEICRLACGGHGFSHYSGMPSLVQTYSANVTYEGENTVMYLQVARYLMKAYKYSLTKKKTLDPSVAYFANLGELLGKKCQVNDNWTLENLKTLLSQAVYYYVSTIGEKMMNDTTSQKDIWNYKAGLRLHQAARSHACYWTFQAFFQQILQIKQKNIQQIMQKVCLLYGVNSIFENIQALVESGVLEPSQITSLKSKKQSLLKQLRPLVSGLLQGIGLNEMIFKSDIASGDIYKNLLQSARKNPLNHQKHEWVDIIKKNLTNTRPKL